MLNIIDLSKSIEHFPHEPRFMRIRVKHSTHSKSKLLIKLLLKLPAKLFPKGWSGWSNDNIKNLGVHSTTHLDAPWHYDKVCEGKKAKTIDEIPLEWCYGAGIVINMSHKKDFELITLKDIKEDLKRSGAIIEKGTIVLIRTDRDKYIGTKKYFTHGTGMSAEATEWLIDQGVKIMGIDQWGWDLPLPYQAQEAKNKNDDKIFWEAHRVGINKEYCHLEQMVNLSSLPDYGFIVSVFPLKVKGASAGPVRAVAILKE
ncbi:MAG: cyclase family protein [Hyphomicrobiales bacterium]